MKRRCWLFVLFGCAGLWGLVPLVAGQALFPAPASHLPTPQVWLLAANGQGQENLLGIGVQIPADHHGYLDTGDEGFYIPLSFSFPTLEGPNSRLLLHTRPTGIRDEVAHATILRGYGAFYFQVDAPTRPLSQGKPLPARFRYQICNDITKICYPPQEVELQLVTAHETQPSSSNASLLRPEPSPSQPVLTMNERLHARFRLSAQQPAWAFILVCTAGLLAVATPCVYPMLPITATILTARGQGSWRLGQLHALVYCAGLISFYALMGFLATTTGTALSVAMTNAWVHIFFALLFAYLGLSMCGLFRFHFLAALIDRLDTLTSKWTGMTGTFCMGATTGLVVSPCVGPITGTILLDIAGQAAEADAARLLRGVFLMSSFGMGLCLPFFVVGLLSSKIPPSGMWLTKTKYLLALPTFYFAYTYYIKGMEIASIPLPVANLLLIGFLAFTGAIIFGLFHARSACPRHVRLTSRAIATALFVVAAYTLYQGLGSALSVGPRPFFAQSAAMSQAGTSEASVEMHANLRWLRSFAGAQQQALTENKPLFVDFYAVWCANCKAFQKLTATDPQLQGALEQVVLVKVYDTDPIFRVLQQEAHYPELRGIGGQPLLPLFAIYSAQGKLVWKGQDYQAVSTMISQLAYAKALGMP